jgi:predicted RNA-binding protein with PUA-like domain
MAYWLLKTEPEDYSFADLERDKHTVWDGVKAPLALQNIAKVSKGDEVFIYHTGKERSIVGTAVVSQGPYPDPKESNPRYLVFEITPLHSLPKAVSLKTLKESDFNAQWELLRLPRLSVVPVSDEQRAKILALANQ